MRTPISVLLPSALLGAALIAGCNGNKDNDDGTDVVIIVDTSDTDTSDDEDVGDTIDEAEDLTGFAIDPRTIYALSEFGRINPAGDRDFYKLTLEAGRVYHFYTEAYDEISDTVVLDTVLRVYDSNRQIVAQNDDGVYRWRETDSGVFVYPETTGDYYVEVLEFGDFDGGTPAGSFQHTYTVFVVDPAVFEDEGNNDTIGQARYAFGIERSSDAFRADLTGTGDTGGTDIHTDETGHTDATGETGETGDTDETDETGDTDTETGTPGETGESDVPGTSDSDMGPIDTAIENPDVFILSPFGPEGVGIETYGILDDADDLDIWPVTLGEAEEGEDPWSYLAMTMWPGYDDHVPELAVFNNRGETMLRTTEIQEVPGSQIFRWPINNRGLMARVTPGETYWVRMRSTTGASGASTFYPWHRVVYLPTLAPLEPEEANDSIATATPLVYEPTSSPDFTGAQIAGSLPSGDDVDYYELDLDGFTGSFSGTYVSVFIQAASHGSLLDTRIAIVNASGEEVEAATVDEDDDGMEIAFDPSIRDYEPGGGQLYIKVEAEDRTGPDTATQYLLGSIVGTTNLFGN